jgi:hypothetical protein
MERVVERQQRAPCAISALRALNRAIRAGRALGALGRAYGKEKVFGSILMGGSHVRGLQVRGLIRSGWVDGLGAGHGGGAVSFAVYIAIFGSVAWARFTSADITS